MKYIKKLYEYIDSLNNQTASYLEVLYKSGKLNAFIKKIANKFGYKSASFLGGGAMGIAYTVSDPSKILKLTWDVGEVNNAFYLKKKNTFRIINYYDVALIKSSVLDVEYDIYAIICDKIKPLNGDEYDILKFMTRGADIGDKKHIYEDAISSNIISYWFTQDKNLIKSVFDILIKIYPKSKHSTIRYCVDEYFKILDECKKYNIPTGDAHHENIGHGTDGQLVFFDCGVYSERDKIYKVKTIEV